MKNRTIKGTQLFDGEQFIYDKVLVINEEGRVEAVLPESDVSKEAIESHEGILIPGMINAHCHLELSHFKGVIPCGTGLVQFLMCVVRNRREQPLLINKLEEAEQEMWANGTAGVADICNTVDAIPIKKKSPIQWHNLVEVLNFRDETLDQRLEHFSGVVQAHKREALPAVLTPHAPYSVSKGTFEALNRSTAGRIISVHNQETKAENELFQCGSGEFLELYQAFNTGLSPFEAPGTNSLRAWLSHFTEGQTILLVHNTYIEEEDLLFAKAHAEKYGLILVYCLCPNANLYIENSLPPIDLLLKHNCRIVLGTDSYSSNWHLSIGAEIATVRKFFPHIPLETVLQWATSNGADVLGWSGLGRFRKGTKPGVVLLNEEDYSVKRLA